ncbi:glyoxylate/hydroxypyruvate reductase A [Rhodoferax sp.]|uniref:2-hydroxyacid dehydrogenase n=1 Tax=Rhodoferax sp. TaxID=50421 RepID=UPI0025D1D50B|nr:glyoxylate/hydroxypyruvate reductase A [Rhodoferax sp.]
MRIALYNPDGAAQFWIDGLHAVWPEAEVALWSPGSPAADFAIAWAPPQAFFDEQPGLQAVFNLGAGVDALMRLRIPPQTQVVRLEDAGMAVQMAEYVCHAVLRHFRGLDAYEADARAGRWRKQDVVVRSDFPVGVMGLGVLGTRVAQALRGFEFPVNAWSRQSKVLADVRGFAGAEQLDAFLAASKVLVCLLPLTVDTQNILDHRSLSKLQQGGYVINVARGAHLVDADLLALLDSGHLAGATLDVFRTEPLPSEHPFWGHPQIHITPHISARTLDAESLAQIIGKLQALLRGQPVDGVVHRDRGY